MRARLFLFFGPVMLTGVGFVGCVSDSVPPPDGGIDTGVDSGTMTDGNGGSDQGPNMSNVMGKVINEFGNPVMNAKIKIGAANATSAMDGTFLLMASDTYDVTIAYDSGTTTSAKRLAMFAGLTTRTPTLQILSSTKFVGNATISNTGITISGNERVSFIVSPTSPTSFSVDTLNPNNFSGGMLTLPWLDGAPLQGSIFALRYTTSTPNAPFASIPTAFTSGDVQTFPALMNAGNVAVSTWSFGMNIGVMMNVSFTYNGANLANNVSLLYRPSPKAALTFSDNAFTNGQASAMYRIPGGVYTTTIAASGARASGAVALTWKVGVSPQNPTATVTFPTEDINGTMPGDGTMVDSTTGFAWSPVASAGYILRVLCPGDGNPVQHAADILTTGTTGHLPDPTGLGYALPTGIPCRWITIAFPGVTKADDLAGVGGWQAYADVYRASTDGWTVSSKPHAFVTK